MPRSRRAEAASIVLSFVGALGLRAVVALSPVESFAQTKPPSEVVNDASAPTTRSILKGMNIEFLESAKDASSIFSFTLAGQKITLLAGKIDLQLSTAMRGRASLEAINLWNSQHRFAKAYADPQGGLHLDADLA